MNRLRSLTLTKCRNLPFILALDPSQTGPLICPCLEELVIYVGGQDEFCITALISMGKERAANHAKLSSITIIDLGNFIPGNEVLRLREHIAHVEYRVDDVSPVDWDPLPGKLYY